MRVSLLSWPDKVRQTIPVVSTLMPVSRYRIPVVFFLSVCLLSSCQSERLTALHKFSGLTMGTSWSILVNADQLPLSKQRLQAEFDAILNRINGEMSTYLPDSELSQINTTHSADWSPISAPLLEVLQAARDISRLTQGTFDVTIAPLLELWGFAPGQDFTVPTDTQVTRTLSLVGYEKLQLDVTASRLKKNHGGMSIELSAIAKGYAVDQLADYLEQLQVANYLVEIGGEIRARGVNDRDAAWQIGIEQPATAADRPNVQQVIKLEDMAMATSGDYRNFFEQDGQRYSHTIDPRSGRPVTHNLASVTVLHPSTMLADSWATALLVAGPEAGYKLAVENGIAAYFIVRRDEEFREQFTPRFRPCLTGADTLRE